MINRFYLGVLVCMFLSFLNETVNAQKTLIDFFLPMQPQAPLVANGIWGDIVPRDTANGIEDTNMSDWCYWDGSIVKDDDGKYHMYASRWSQGYHHSTAWKNHSKGIHAVSDNMFGPYKDQGLTWPYWWEGRGSNVVGLRMHDGRYALVTSEITQGEIFIGDNPNGPFEFQGEIQIDYNGFSRGTAQYNFAPNRMSNVMVVLRPDGRYMIVPRQCSSLISDNGIMGPYKILHGAAWAGLEGVPQEYMEDPTIWYSDGLYHIVVNYHGEDKSFHLTSRDGIHHWKNRGLAVNKRQGLFRYTDGTVNDWETVQRPTVYLEDGVIKCFNFSVIDVHKGMDGANDQHGSKIIVVPFDGVAFGEAMREMIRKEDSIVDATSIPEPWQSIDIGSYRIEGKSNLNEEDNLFKIRSTGKNINGTADDFRFVYQKVKGDCMITAQVMMQDNTNPFAKAGVMIRKSLDDNAVNSAMLISAREGANFQYRKTPGGNTDSLHVNGPRAPYWVRILKSGNKIISSISSGNQVPFTTVGTIDIDLGTDSLYLGLALSSNSDRLNTTRFQHIELSSLNDQDKILSHNLPNQIPATYPIKIEVEYLCSQERDINILIRNITNWDNGVGSVTKTVNGYGKTIIEFTPLKTIKDTDEYQWEMNMREKGQNWKTNIEGTQFKVLAKLETPKVDLESIQISKEQLHIYKGETASLSASLQPENADDKKIIWKTDNPVIAQVDYLLGTVYALKSGTCHIIALNLETGISDSCKVVVSNPLGQKNIKPVNFKIYPNPTVGELTIENNDLAYDWVEILDFSGRVLCHSSIKNLTKKSISIRLNAAKGSLLIVKLCGETNMVVQKVMVGNERHLQ